MTQASVLATTVRECWTQKQLRMRGLDGGELRVLGDDPSWLSLRTGGRHFYQRLDIDLKAEDAFALAAAADREICRLTTRAKRYLQRTPRCYFPREEKP